MFNSQARQTATGENPVKSSSAPTQVPANLYSSAAAASVSACDDDMYTLLHAPQLSAPTKATLHALTAVPAGLLNRSSGSKAKGRSGRGHKLAREGQIVSKLFDNRASRPQPINGISLEQGIQLEMTQLFPSFIVSSATITASTFNSRTFAISDFTAAASLLTVFDQYRIDQIECWLECQTPNSTVNPPEVFSAVDLDDGNVPSSVGQVQDHQGAIVAGGLAGHYHRWKPHLAVAVYSGAFTSFSNQPATWIDSASPNVQHYGMKVATVSLGSPLSYALVTRVVVSLRAPSIN